MAGAQEVAKQLKDHQAAKPSTGDWPKELADVSGKIAQAELALHDLENAQEAASRRERSLAYRLAQARLPWQWSLDSFPFDRQPGVSKTQIQTLAGLDFLRRTDNVLLIGNTESAT